jgi:hypothetical protein
MQMETGIENGISIRKAIAFATIASGVVAAYLMYRRGVSLGAIAKQTISSPVGSLVSEVKNAV